MSDPCLSCRVPNGCDEEHPLCGYRQVKRVSDVVRAAKYRRESRMKKIVSELRWLSERRVEKAAWAVMRAVA